MTTNSFELTVHEAKERLEVAHRLLVQARLQRSIFEDMQQDIVRALAKGRGR